MATYEIIIRDETIGNGTNTPNTTPQPNKPNWVAPSNKPFPSNTTDEDSNNFSLKATAKVVYDMANQFVLGRIGEFTRDSLTQQKISAITQLGSIGMSFVVNPVLGATHLMTTTASNMIDYSIRVQKQVEYNQVMLQRAGYINRSRN